MKEKKNLWIVIHEHCHDVSSYVVECPRSPTEPEVIAYCEPEVIAYCDLDFEPERGEVISISGFDPKSEIIKIP